MPVRPVLEIIMSPLVERLRAEGFPLPEPPIRYYPDGSLWTDNVFAVQGAHQVIGMKEPGAYGASSFRSLAAFGGDVPNISPCYGLTYPGWFDWALSEHDELGVLTYPGMLGAVSAEEHELDHIRVLLKFYQKITAPIAEEIAGAVRTWFKGIGSVGVFGEAGISSIGSVLHYRGREAGFELDAHAAGQETLNTLYLALLSWAMARRKLLWMIHLAADRNEKVFSADSCITLS